MRLMSAFRGRTSTVEASSRQRRNGRAVALALATMSGPLLCGAGAHAADQPVAAPPPPMPPPIDVNDPLEPVNRTMFRVDSGINRLLAGKFRIIGTVKWIPAPVREGLFNAFDNLEEPATFANDLFQRKPAKAVKAAGRFGINTTIGVAGVFDLASKLGVKRAREDFGQTLAVYGVKAGPYIYLPLSGPLTLRDGLGGFVDGYFSPRHWLPMTRLERQGVSVVKYGVQPSTIGIRQVARGAAVAGETRDEYATLRQLYYDQRAAQIADQPNLADDPVSAFPEVKEGKHPPGQRPTG